MNLTKHTILPLLALMLTLFSACHDEEAVSVPGTETGDGLHIALSLSGKQPLYANAGKQTRTTIEGETGLNENTVSTVDFFLFNPDTDGNYNTINGHWRFSLTETEQTNQKDNSTDSYATEYFTLYSGNDWKNRLGITTTSRIYAIANLPSSVNVSTWAEFCALTVTDAAIYKKHTSATEAGTQEIPNKHFLMDGFNSFTEADLGKNTHQVTVPLRRAAAKVRVNIYKATSWKDENDKDVSIDTKAIEALVKNYATQTKVVTPEGSEGLGETSPVGDYATLASASRTGTNGFTAKTEIKDESCEYLTSVLFYTFAHEWGETESLGDETTFIMNLPYTIPTGETKSPRPENWYKIVFVPDGGKHYNRNTFYEVDVLVAYDGSEESYEPTPVTNPQYKISEWYPEEFNVENTTPVDYLILDRYYIDMRNVADTTITFYSSNNVTVEVVHDVSTETDFVWPADFPNKDYYVGDAIDDAQEGLLDMGAGTIADIPGIYYPDKENRRIPIYTATSGNNTNHSTDISYNTPNNFTDLNYAVYKPVTVTGYTGGNTAYPTNKEGSEVYITWPSDEYSENGKLINIYSAIPRNATLRFITLKVTMQKKHSEGSITRYVVIKQYPLEYIVNQFGYYSYMDCGNDGMLSGGNVENKVTYVQTFEKNTVTDGIYTLWDNYGSGKTVKVPKEITTTGVNSATTLNGHLSSTGEFKCKFYLDGTDKTYNESPYNYKLHQWTDAEGIHIGTIYQAGDQYKDATNGSSTQNDNSIGLHANTPSNNNRMYEVVITATSSKYRIGYPKLVDATTGKETESTNSNLQADDSYSNNRLVSPHFVIASQLGNNPATAYWEAARDRCLHYVEVDNKGNVYNNWRLPTIAELSIIKDFQLDPDVYNVTMNRILNSDGEGNPLYWTAGRYEYVHTTGAGTEDDQTFQAPPTGATGYTFTHNNGTEYTTEFQISYDETEVIPMPVANSIKYYKKKTENITDENGNVTGTKDVRDGEWKETDGVDMILIKKTVTINGVEYKQRDFELPNRDQFKNPIRVRCVRDIKN